MAEQNSCLFVKTIGHGLSEGSDHWVRGGGVLVLFRETVIQFSLK